jgi:small subunit ribosomal protein S33
VGGAKLYRARQTRSGSAPATILLVSGGEHCCSACKFCRAILLHPELFATAISSRFSHRQYDSSGIKIQSPGACKGMSALTDINYRSNPPIPHLSSTCHRYQEHATTNNTQLPTTRSSQQHAANTTLQLQSTIFSTTYNPTRIRLGNKILRQRLRGPQLAQYYPRKTATIEDIQKSFKKFGLETWNGYEEDRLEGLQIAKLRGKGAPKKKRTAEGEFELG